MQPTAYIHRIGLPLLLCAAVAGLSSCKLMRKNYTVMSDRVTPAQADDVMVETGGADLPPIAAAAPGSPRPAAPVAAPSGTSGRVITVQPGNTLSGLARQHGTSVSALCAANGITPTTPIRIGQQLRLPAGGEAAYRPAPAPAGSPKAPARAGRSYTVKRGDTLSGIAARHGVSTAALRRANNLTPQQADRIREGQTLRLPATAR